MRDRFLQFIATIPRRAGRKFRIVTQRRVQCFHLVLPFVEGKHGLEIGGPTDVFQGWRSPSRCYWTSAPLPIYDRIGILDNCNFRDTTMWGVHGDTYRFSPVRPPGKIIIAEGTSIQQIQGSTYDFILSSHNLEHFANPVKALLEWKRITRPEGALILVLPHFEQTFDHRRKPTPVDHMVDDYSRDVGEDDPTHMAEYVRLVLYRLR